MPEADLVRFLVLLPLLTTAKPRGRPRSSARAVPTCCHYPCPYCILPLPPPPFLLLRYEREREGNSECTLRRGGEVRVRFVRVGEDVRDTLRRVAGSEPLEAPRGPRLARRRIAGGRRSGAGSRGRGSAVVQ